MCKSITSVYACAQVITGVTEEHVLPPQNAMYLMGFDPWTSGIASHRSTN